MSYTYKPLKVGGSFLDHLMLIFKGFTDTRIWNKKYIISIQNEFIASVIKLGHTFLQDNQECWNIRKWKSRYVK